MKARLENGKIVTYPTLPNIWKNILNFPMSDVETFESEGFYELIEPTFNPQLQHLGELYFDEVNKLFTYQVIDKTQAEIDCETAMGGWHHPDLPKRITAPAELINDYPAIGVHMWIHKLPVEPSSDGSLVYLYMKEVSPQHQTLVDSLNGVISIQTRPGTE